MTDEEFNELHSNAISTEELWKLSENVNLTVLQRQKVDKEWYESYMADIIISMGR